MGSNQEQAPIPQSNRTIPSPILRNPSMGFRGFRGPREDLCVILLDRGPKTPTVPSKVAPHIHPLLHSHHNPILYYISMPEPQTMFHHPVTWLISKSSPSFPFSTGSLLSSNFALNSMRPETARAASFSCSCKVFPGQLKDVI